MKKNACARARKRLRRKVTHARAHRVPLIRSRRPVFAAVLLRMNMSNMLKKNMSLCMMKKQSLCTLSCTPVSWRALRARASAVRVRENWRCEKACHTHHEKHVGAVDAMQQEQQRDAPVEQSALRAKNAALVEVVDGGAGAVRGFARLGLTAETRSHGTAPCRPRRHR